MKTSAPSNKSNRDKAHAAFANSIQWFKTPLGVFSALLALYTIVFWLLWDGIGPGDAEHYIATALDISSGGTFVGQDHWSLRYPLVLPMALTFAVIGPSEFAASMPSFIYGALLVAVSFFFGRRHLGDVTGIPLTLLVATSAFFSIQSSEIRIYSIEIFFVVTSLWLFIEGTQHATFDRKTIFAAGLFAGTAWLCRESTLFLPVTIGTAAIFMTRRWLTLSLTAAAGFLTIIIGELIYYLLATGDALYRYHVDLAHRTIGDNPITEATAQQLPFLTFLTKPLSELATYTSVTPFVLAAILLILVSLKLAAPSAAVRRVMVIFALGAVLSLTICSYALGLPYVFYYPLLSYTALVFTAVALTAIYRRFGAVLALPVLAALVVLNFAAADFRDYGQYKEAQALANFVERYDEPIFSDRTSVSRARMLLRLGGATQAQAEQKLIADGAPRAGMLVYQATPVGVGYSISERPDWVVLKKLRPREPSWTKTILRKLIPSGARPSHLNEILYSPDPVVLYRVPPE